MVMWVSDDPRADCLLLLHPYQFRRVTFASPEFSRGQPSTPEWIRFQGGLCHVSYCCESNQANPFDAEPARFTTAQHACGKRQFSRQGMTSRFGGRVVFVMSRTLSNHENMVTSQDMYDDADNHCILRLPVAHRLVRSHKSSNAVCVTPPSRSNTTFATRFGCKVFVIVVRKKYCCGKIRTGCERSSPKIPRCGYRLLGRSSDAGMGAES